MARPTTSADGLAADAVLRQLNETSKRAGVLEAAVYSVVSTDSYDDPAQALHSELATTLSRLVPLLRPARRMGRLARRRTSRRA